MLACFLIILFFLPIILIDTAIEKRFTSEELTEMGVRLDYSHSPE
ncbi:MAG TPA: hypothetical protein VIO61_06385 [Anaerolineaceae bacterium]